MVEVRPAGAPAASGEPVVLDVQALGLREVNRTLKSLPDGASAVVTNPRGTHNIAVGLFNRIHVTIEGHCGHYIAGLCDGPDVTVHGSAGWAVGENLMSGTVRVSGNASERAGSSAHGGRIFVAGNTSSRAGISLKGGTVVIAGDAGSMTAFMAQAGTVLIGGDVGDGLGDSLYEAVVYVGGRIGSLGADARVEDLTEADVARVTELVRDGGFDHIDPQNVTRVASARTLYNFDALKDQKY